MTITANDPDILSLIKITDQNNKVVEWQYNAFPDGQVQIKIHKNDLHDGASFNVKASLPNPIVLDLFYQLMYNLNYPLNSVTVNYLYGARCDKEESGDYFVSNVAYQVLDTIYGIVSYPCRFLAPHSIDYFEEFSDAQFSPIYTIPDCVHLSDYDCVVFPDESAYKRYADQLNGKEYVICEKRRDQETGNIISHKIPSLPDGVKKVILLDDLCDGGRSFLSISDTLPQDTDIKLDLFVFHGVLSNNALPQLLDKFNKVIVSNSLNTPQKQYNDLSEQDKNRVVIFDVWN